MTHPTFHREGPSGWRSKRTTSDWFREDLTQRDRKTLVALLFGVRHSLEGREGCRLFEELLQVLDDEYHHLKTSGYP